MRWMRRRGDRVTIIKGKYDGYQGTLESNVFQRTVDHPDGWVNDRHVMLDSEELAPVRWDQVKVCGSSSDLGFRLMVL